ncbi:MAG: hypothetical protein M3T55_03215 [Pseudomonadota bacterium]|nr:hypothetical protein [Pseudomonadota bacterium]
MRISFKRKFIFLANRRCGSTSVRKALDPTSDVKGSRPGPLDHHACLRTVERYVVTQGYRLQDFFIFTTIRNPWARVVSIYHYGLREPASIWHAASKEAGSFHAFCFHPVLDQVFGLGSTVPECPQDINSFTSSVAAVPVDAYDCSPAGFHAMQEKLRGDVGLPTVFIQHANASEHPPYAAFYADPKFGHAARARIAELFECDVSFGYTFEDETAQFPRLTLPLKAISGNRARPDATP